MALPQPEHCAASKNTEPISNEGQIRARSLLCGLLLIPPVVFWVAGMENVYGGRPTYLSVFFHAVILLAALHVINSGMRRIFLRAAFTRAELLLIYVMIGVSSGIVGDQFMAVLIPSLAHPFRYADDINKWAQRLLPFLPRHAVVSDPIAVRNFYEGGVSLYARENWLPWLVPGLLWASFIAVVQLMCLSVNILMRRQWTHYEKLSFPLVTIPLEMTASSDPPLWRNKLMWIGFGISAFIDILNGLQVHYPFLLPFNVKVRWMQFTPRWAAALTTTGLAFYPFIIGTAYFLPSDLTFSTWFFLLFFRVQRAFFSALGYPSPYPWCTTAKSVAPAMLEQGIGSYIAVVVFSIWAARRHLKVVWTAIWKGLTVTSDKQTTIPPAEVKEYRLALLTLLIGMTLTTWFGYTLHLPMTIAFFYIFLYLVVTTAIAKIRAEAGAPTHGFHFAGPDHILLTLVGSKDMSVRQMAGWGLFFGFNRAYTGVPMPHQLEGMRIGELLGVNRQRMTAAIALATVLGCYAGVWALLHLCFREGVDRMKEPVRWLSPQGWQIVNEWLNQPSGPNWSGLGGILFGFGFAVFLMQMRYQFVWWPFHPIGYAIAADWTTGLIWFPLLLGWLAKTIVLRYFGHRAYRNGIPLALGLILGEFAVGGFWSVFAMITRKPQYFFWT